MKLVLYEEKLNDFYPIINFYPQFHLRVGTKNIAENTKKFFKKTELNFITRELFEFSRITPQKPTLYLSSRLLMTKRFILPKCDTKFTVDSEVVGFIKYDPPFPGDLPEVEKSLRTIGPSQQISGFVLNKVWDLIRLNESMLINQFEAKITERKIPKRLNVIGSKKNLFVAKETSIYDLIMIDVRDGPVYIDEGAVIQPFTTIVGPSYIGQRTIVGRAKIIKSSIGPSCRIGGEVESCIFQGYANKYHEGFLGHSFIGEWVNIGASTTNSDLKNNYGPVRVVIGDKEFDTGMMKLGCFIGDHTKLGIGTLIPTGAVIGSFVNFFGGGMMPRYVPSFRWLTSEKQEDHDLEKALTTARIVMQRRKIKMSRQYEDIIRKSHKWQSL